LTKDKKTVIQKLDTTFSFLYQIFSFRSSSGEIEIAKVLYISL